MKHPLLITLLAGIAATSTPILAQDDGDAPPAQRSSTTVKSQMKTFDKSLDVIIDFVKKPEGDAPMADVAAAQEALHNAKQIAPRLTDEQPADEQAEFVKAYKLQINKTIRGMLDVEDALLQKDWKAAAVALEELQKLKKPGHDKFKGKRRRRGE